MKDYYGWRARVGLVYMASSTVMEPEFWAMAPDGVSIHTARIPLPSPTVRGLTQMMESDLVEACCRDLAAAPLHVIIFGGSSATFLNGLRWDEAVRARMAKVANGIPVTTTSTAILDALRALRIQRVSVITPYIAEVTARARTFLEQNGLTVLNAEGMGISDDLEIGAIPLDRVYEFVRRCAHPEAQGVFVSCTNLRTIGAIVALEEDLGIPVVSAVQASLWSCLRIAGVRSRREGFGRLLSLL